MWRQPEYEESKRETREKLLIKKRNELTTWTHSASSRVGDRCFRREGPPSKRAITICECKLRFDDGSITVDEIEHFKRKIEKIKENESKRGEVRFYF